MFPWTCSDFSLMDAIESGIVKLPRIPVSDNLPTSETLTFRNLWDHIGKQMPKAGAGKGGKADPLLLPIKLQTALYALYGHYEKTFNEWDTEGIDVPPRLHRRVQQHLHVPTDIRMDFGLREDG